MSDTLRADDALLAIANNAVALLKDAKLLFDHGRFPAAAALAVLSREEAAKFSQVKFKLEGWHGTLTSHAKKQSIAAKYDRAEAAGIALRTTTELHEVFDADANYPPIAGAAELEDIKQAGFYVRVDGLGKLTSDPPRRISKKVATKCISDARSALEQVFKLELVRRTLPPLAQSLKE